MAFERIYIGTWLPRTFVHLNEINDFLKYVKGTGLDAKKLFELRKSLQIDTESIIFSNGPDIDKITFSSGRIRATITEDGIVLLTLEKVEDELKDTRLLEDFYTNKLGPALAHLFSRGAPLPQSLIQIEETHPKVYVGSEFSDSEVAGMLDKTHEKLLSQVSTKNGLHIYYGNESEFIKLIHPDDKAVPEKLVFYVVFINSFSKLLEKYLLTHRTVWEEISLIRNAQDIRYSDFPAIRARIMDMLKTISFVRTRLRQMNEMVAQRESIAPELIKQKLADIGAQQFRVLKSSCSYFEDLWGMTADYADSTLKLFETLFEESTRREIRLLQIITFVGVVAGFFGMNVAFPWEERWPSVFLSSFVVLAIIIATGMVFYFVTKVFILNRKFRIK
jgi:hypothetical protein